VRERSFPFSVLLGGEDYARGLTMTATNLFSEDGMTGILREFDDFVKVRRWFAHFHCCGGRHGIPYGRRGLWPSWYRPPMLAYDNVPYWIFSRSEG